MTNTLTLITAPLMEVVTKLSARVRMALTV